MYFFSARRPRRKKPSKRKAVSKDLPDDVVELPPGWESRPSVAGPLSSGRCPTLEYVAKFFMTFRDFYVITE